VLIRPDGHVAWAADQLDDGGEQVRSALARWLNPETTLSHSPEPSAPFASLGAPLAQSHRRASWSRDLGID
jgi:hypothetical protein